MNPVLKRELAYYNQFYDEAAMAHFCKAAVAPFRKYLAGRIVRATAAGPGSSAPSVGCGIGDLEIQLAVGGSITGVDLSPRAIPHAQRRAPFEGSLCGWIVGFSASRYALRGRKLRSSLCITHRPTN